MRKFKTFDAIQMARDTSSAYSARSYNSWVAVCRLLDSRGFNRWEAEAILRSKITRHCRDEFSKTYPANSTCVKKYLDKYKVKPRCSYVNKLVMETFDGSVAGCPNLHLELNKDGIPCTRGTMPGNPSGGSTLVPIGTPNCCNPHSETYWCM